MAGDWIKMRGNLWDDPRVSKLCDLTDSGEAQVIGALYWLWSTADQHTENGIMPGLTLRQMDRKTGLAGFGDALCAIGWLVDHPEGVRVVRFEEHNGKSAKKRCQTAIRVANHKDGNAEVTHTALPSESCSVTGALPREEKSREDKNKPLSVVERVGDEPHEHQPAADIPRKGIVCGLLRKAGMTDAAPHYLTEDVWASILSRRTDDEIVQVAIAKMASRPGQRTGLKYIAPVLMQDPEPIVANARASPGRSNGRQSRIDNYAAEAAAARGGYENEHSLRGTERDITGESTRVA